MRYRILTTAGLELARKALVNRAKVPDLTMHEAVVGSGDIFEDKVLADVASAIRRAQQRAKRRGQGADEVDRHCFEVVHRRLPSDELMLANMAFWSRFAIVHLSDAIYARFPGRKGKTNLDNFGLGSRKECWPYKLWVRGAVSFEPSRKDPYAMGRIGGVEMWTSHVHRQNFMTVPQVFRGVMRFQYPPRLKGRPFLHEGEEDSGKGGFPGVRTLIKRLKENWASVEYSLLDEKDVGRLVRRHSKGLCKPDGKKAIA
jgi:hypothetical protein